MTGLLHEKSFSRKSFLRGGGALIVGFSMLSAGGLSGKASAEVEALNTPPDPTQVDSFLAINADNTVTLYPLYYEFGQGTYTGFTQIVAEELYMDVGNVKIQQLWNSAIHPRVNWGTNAASNGTANGGPPIRQAAAQAYQVLLGLASTKLNVPVSALSVSNGVVSGGGSSVTYASLLSGQQFNTVIAGQPTSSSITSTTAAAAPGAFAPGTPVPLKDPSTYTVVGTRVPRIDIPDKVTGAITYVQNVYVPGMVHGRPVRPRGQASLFGLSPAGGPASFTVVSVNKNSIAHIPDVQVIQQGNFVGVVAPLEFNAIQAAAQLEVTWSEGDTLPGSGDFYGAMREMPNQQTVVLNYGDVDTAIPSAAKVLEATYEWPFQLHGPIGPPCCIVDIPPSGGTPTIIVSGQDAWGYRTYVSQVVPSVNPNDIQVLHFETASSFNPAPLYSAVADAAILSSVVGKPVRVQYMRWDDFGYTAYAQSNIADLTAGLDGSGNLIAYDYKSTMMPFSNNPSSASIQIGIPVPADSGSFTSVRGAPTAAGINSDNTPALGGARIETFASGDQYTPNIPNRRVTGIVPHSLFKLAPLRAPCCVQPGFASESFVDEIAHAAGQDPYLYRRNMTTQPLWLAVLETVASAAGWTPRVANSLKQAGPVVKGRGISIAGETHLMSDVYSGAVAEVEVDLKTGKVVVTHIYGVQDSGLVVNPASIENQLTGMMVRGVSRTLYEGLTFSKQRVTSLDWVTYPILRFADTPTVTAIVISHDEIVPAADSPIQMAGPRYRGAGESMEAAVPAAIANAVFDATGVRFRQVPLTPPKVLYGLKAAGVA